MANPTLPPELEALGFGDELDEAFRRVHPNPTRHGCPSHDVLEALSRRGRPIGHPAYEHLLVCSPCYAEVRDMQKAHVLAMHERLARRWWVAAAGAAAFVVSFGVWRLAPNRGATPGEADAPVQVTLDLRPYSVTRSLTEAGAPPPLELASDLLELKLLLPVGSESGTYDVELLDAEQRSLASAHGEAALRDSVTMLKVTLNVGEVTSGLHRIAVRRAGDAWRVYPALVRRR